MVHHASYRPAGISEVLFEDNVPDDQIRALPKFGNDFINCAGIMDATLVGLSNHPPTPIGRQKASKWHEPNVFVFCTHAVRVLDICLGVFVVCVQRVHLVRRRQLVSPPRLFCNQPQTRASPCQWRSASVRDRSQSIQSAAALQ